MHVPVPLYQGTNSGAGTRRRKRRSDFDVQMESEMATVVDNGSGGGNTVLAFIVGAVLVAVVVIGFFMWNGSQSGAPAPKPGIELKVQGGN
jgi:hypothetical protein